MPHSTEVGQSGPPQRMATLAGVRPFCARQCRMARSVMEFMPTSRRTATLSERFSPKTCRERPGHLSMQLACADVQRRKELRIVTFGVWVEDSLTRPFRDARRFPSPGL
jgi:hypothetical protein